MNVDFHMHTNHSDGGYTYDELINECLKKDIRYLALTDHNTFSKCHNLPNGMKAINGMEMDVRYKDKTFHMLLYNFNEKSLELKKYFRRSRRHEISRFHKNIDQIIKEYNLTIDKKLITKFIRNNNYFDRVRMNKLLVEAHICDEMKDAYTKYTHILPKTKRYAIDMKEYVKIARDSKGIMSLAHPLKYGLNMDEIKKIILELKDKYHLQVIEAINNHQTKEEEKELIEFCNKNDLLISAGSDSHYKVGVESKKKVGIVLDRELKIEDVTFLRLVNKDE